MWWGCVMCVFPASHPIQAWVLVVLCATESKEKHTEQKENVYQNDINILVIFVLCMCVLALPHCLLFHFLWHLSYAWWFMYFFLFSRTPSNVICHWVIYCGLSGYKIRVLIIINPVILAKIIPSVCGLMLNDVNSHRKPPSFNMSCLCPLLSCPFNLSL